MTEVPHLETFAKAAETANFSATARALGITQAAVSQRIQAIEHDLRTALFQRHGGRVELTDAGRSLYKYAQQIGRLHAEARERLGGQAPRLKGEMSLAASSIPGEHVLPSMLASFRRKHPHIQVRMTISDSDDVLSLVERGKVHVGFTGRKSANSNLEWKTIATDELLLVVRTKHPWSRRQSVPWNKVVEQPLIMREAGSGSRYCFEQALIAHGFSLRDLKIVLELGSNEAIKESVRRGVGAAVLSSHAVQKERKAGRLHTLRVQGLDLKRTMYLVRDRRRMLSLPERALLDFISRG